MCVVTGEPGFYETVLSSVWRCESVPDVFVQTAILTAHSQRQRDTYYHLQHPRHRGKLVFIWNISSG